MPSFRIRLSLNRTVSRPLLLAGMENGLDARDEFPDGSVPEVAKGGGGPGRSSDEQESLIPEKAVIQAAGGRSLSGG